MLPAPDDYWSIRDKFIDAPARFEVVVSAIYQQILTVGDSAIDCGAHIGKHTIPMARAVGPTGTVIAFEPIDEKRAQLQNRVISEGLADVVQVMAGCVGNEVGSVSFTYVPDDPGKSAMHLRTDLENNDKKMETASRRVVSITRLDDMPNLPRTRFIKIDVEGAELAVVQGGLKTIGRHRPVVHFEMGLPSLEPFGVTPEDIRLLFTSLNYRIYDILGNDVSDRDMFAVSALTDGVYDYIATPEDFPDPRLVRQCASSIFSAPDHDFAPLA